MLRKTFPLTFSNHSVTNSRVKESVVVFIINALQTTNIYRRICDAAGGGGHRLEIAGTVLVVQHLHAGVTCTEMCEIYGVPAAITFHASAQHNGCTNQRLTSPGQANNIPGKVITVPPGLTRSLVTYQGKHEYVLRTTGPRGEHQRISQQSTINTPKGTPD